MKKSKQRSSKFQLRRSMVVPVAAGLVTLFVPFAASAQTTAATTELNNSTAVKQIGASTAHNLGYTGQGVKIAVLDTGLNTAHPDLVGRVLPGRNFTTTNTSYIKDVVGHGTHVAGIIAANRNSVGMFGVAYSSQIMPVKVIADSGTGSTTWINNGIRWAADQGAFIASMSISSTSAFDPAGMKYAINKGMLLIAGAGNRGALNPDYPARYASQVWAKGQMINVVAVDSANQITSWSNRAGDAMNFTLAAPGVNVLSTSNSNTYVYKSGTSMATPVVTGAAALVKSRWSYLSAYDVANILFVTATDLGAPGVDSVYGRGLVNVDKAMKPIGTVVTVNYNGQPIPVYGTVTGGALAPIVKTASVTGTMKVIGLDNYGRDFSTNLGNSAMRARPILSSELFSNEPINKPGSQTGLRMAQGNALMALPVAHLGFMDQAVSLASRFNLGSNWSVTPALAAQPDKAQAASLSMSRSFANTGEFGLAMSQMNEHQTFLGGSAQGALSLGRSSTTALAFFAKSELDDQTSVDASMSFGSTPGAQGNLLSTSAAMSQAVRFSLTRRDMVSDGDRMTFSVDQPMRVTGGTLTIDRMTGLDSNMKPIMERNSMSLKPDGREIRVGLNYSVPMSRTSKLQMAAMYRIQPGHFADAAPEQAASIRYQALF